MLQFTNAVETSEKWTACGPLAAPKAKMVFCFQNVVNVLSNYSVFQVGCTEDGSRPCNHQLNLR